MSRDKDSTKKHFYFLPTRKKNLNYFSIVHDESKVSEIGSFIEKAAANGDIISIAAIDSYRILYFDAYIENFDSFRHEVYLIKSNLELKVLSYENILDIKIKEI